MKSALFFAVLIAPTFLFAQDTDNNPYAFNISNPGKVLYWQGEPGKSPLMLNSCARTRRGEQCMAPPAEVLQPDALNRRLRAIRREPDMTFCKLFKYANRHSNEFAINILNSKQLKTGIPGNPGVVFMRCNSETPGIRILYWMDFPNDVVLPALDPVEEERRLMKYFISAALVAPVQGSGVGR